MIKNQLRLIPLTSEFIGNKQIYDRIYTYLQLNSYIGKDQYGIQHRFIYNTVVDNLGNLHKSCSIQVVKNKEKNSFKNFCSYNTFVKSFKLLLEPTEEYKEAIGYLKRGQIIDIHKKLVDVYYIREDLTPNKFIPCRTLEHLMNIKSNHVIKVYTYLVSKYNYKQNTSSTEKYRFTIQELANAIGYTSKSIYWNIEYILEELKKCGLIKFHKKKVKTQKGNETYYYFLDYANLELPTDNAENQDNSPITHCIDNNGDFCF